MKNETTKIMGTALVGFLLGAIAIVFIKDEGESDLLLRDDAVNRSVEASAKALRDTAKALGSLSVKLEALEARKQGTGEHAAKPGQVMVGLSSEQEARIIDKLRSIIVAMIPKIDAKKDFRETEVQQISRDQILNNWPTSEVATSKLLFSSETDMIEQLGRPDRIKMADYGVVQWQYPWGIVRFIGGRLSVVAYKD